MAEEVANITSMILGVTSELDITPQGLIAKDKNNPNYVVVLNSAGLGVSTDGGMTFRNAITGRGIVAERILAGEIKGSTLRTDSGSNYVHIEKQFIRLMESNLTRMYFGYYWNKNGRMQPTILLHENIDTSRFSDGTLTISQQNLGSYYTGSIGIAKGETAPGDTYYPSTLYLNSNGNTHLFGDNKTTVTGEMGIDFRSFRQVSTFASLIRLEASGSADILSGNRLFIRGTNGITFNTSSFVEFNSQVSTQGVNIAGNGPDALGTIKYMNGNKGWGAYLHIGSQGWAFINISL